MKKVRLNVRWFACTLVCAMGWFCIYGCTRPSDDNTSIGESQSEANIEIPPELADGKSIYDANCGSCHDSSRDGAPRLGFQPAWTRRTAQGEATLTKNAIKGLEMMPPRGDNAELTDEQIGQVVKYMMYRADRGIPAKH